jgi:hypothetical protein
MFLALKPSSLHHLLKCMCVGTYVPFKLTCSFNQKDFKFSYTLNVCDDSKYGPKILP